MYQNLSVLTRCPMFEGIAADELPALLLCLKAREKEYQRGETVIEPGSSITELGLVLSGSVQVWQTDYWGHQTLIHRLERTDVFAESFAIARQRIPLGVTAAEPSRILFLSADTLIRPCGSGCSSHNILNANCARMLAQKNISLTDNIRHLSKRSIHNKLISYLSDLAARQGSDRVVPPLSRQELADFLCVDRSAMTRSLYQMQDDGILSIEGRMIRLNGAHSQMEEALPQDRQTSLSTPSYGLFKVNIQADIRNL